ncbi:MAG: hypothetical protein U0163_08365 [Gemmatimonadaceae bacterium]
MMISPRNPERPIAALIAPDIIALLDESPNDVAAETEEMHPADLADIAELMPQEKVVEFLRALGNERAGAVLEYIDEAVRAELLEEMNPELAAQLVGAMTPDERADVLEELPDETADEILSDLPTAARQETERLLQYEPDTAGGAHDDAVRRRLAEPNGGGCVVARPRGCPVGAARVHASDLRNRRRWCLAWRDVPT